MVFEVEPVEPLVARWARDVPMLAEGLPNCEEVQGFLKKMVSASNLWPQASRMPREELDTLGIESFATTGHSSEDCGKGGPTAQGASTSW